MKQKIRRKHHELLHQCNPAWEEKGVYTVGLVDFIEANRPIVNFYEASMAAETLTSLLSVIELATGPSVDPLNDMEQVASGLHHISEACRLIALRLNEIIESVEDPES